MARARITDRSGNSTHGRFWKSSERCAAVEPSRSRGCEEVEQARRGHVERWGAARAVEFFIHQAIMAAIGDELSTQPWRDVAQVGREMSEERWRTY
jgi:hypothetical protein